MDNEGNNFAELKEAVIMDYSIGVLTPAQMLAIETYMTLNAQACENLRSMDSIGGAILESDACETTPIDNNCFNKICDRLEDLDYNDNPVKTCEILPTTIINYIDCDAGSIPWKKLAPGIEYFDIDMSLENGEKAQLLKMAPGKSVFEHSHDGLELTVVLDGAFHDNTGVYCRGDLAIEQGHDHAHRPVADEALGCICLAVTTAPLHFTGLLGAVINPFMK